MNNEDTIQVPPAPAHLSDKAQEKWTATYKSAMEAAKRDTTDERAQRIAALKTANAIQAVKPPTSAAEIDALEDWQVVRRETKPVKLPGQKQETMCSVCVTIDGRKYIFPAAPAPAPVADDDDSGKKKGKKGPDAS